MWKLWKSETFIQWITNNWDVKIIRRPASKEAISNLKKYKFKENTNCNCAICLDKISEDTEVTELPCEHIFCTECINPWLKNENNNCPLCKKSIEDNTPNFHSKKSFPELSKLKRKSKQENSKKKSSWADIARKSEKKY